MVINIIRPVQSTYNLSDLITGRQVKDINDMTATDIAYSLHFYRFKHYGLSYFSSDEYARTRFGIDRDFIIKIQLGGLLNAFDIATNGITDGRAYRMAKCIRDNGFCRISNTKDRVLSITAQSQYVGSAHDEVSKCGTKEADLGEFNVTTSIGGCMNTTTVTTPVLVTTKSQFSCGFTGTLIRMYYGCHITILRLSCELSFTSFYMAFLALATTASTTTTKRLLLADFFGGG